MEAKDRIKFRIGFSRMEKKYEWKDHLIFMGLLSGWLCGSTGESRSRAFIWMTCISGPATESRAFCSVIFPMGMPVFPLPYYLAAWLEMAVVGNHVSWISYPLTSRF